MSDTAEGWEDVELAALGRVAVSFTELEWQAGRLLAGFISPRDVAFILTAGEDLRWMLDKLSVIAADALGDPLASSALQDWVKASRCVVERRNQLTHSYYLPVAGERALTRMKASTRGGSWGGQSQPIGLADQDARRATKDRARAVAQAILGQLDNPAAAPQARRELLAAVTDAVYAGEPDLERLDRAYRDVFEPGGGTIRKATGHPSAPFTIDAMTGLTEARLAAVSALTAGKVTDEALISARDAHVFAYAEYAAKQHLLAATAPAGTGHLYEPVTADDTLSNCCGHLLTAIGLEIMHPDTAEQLRRERAFRRRPTPAMVGLTAQARLGG